MKLLKKPWSHDYRSKRFTSKVLGFGAIPQLVTTLNRPRMEPLDQGDTLECAAFAAVANGHYIHGGDFDVQYQVDKISRLQGHPVDASGSDPNAAMDSQVFTKRGGYLPKGDFHPEKIDANDEEAMNFADSGYIKPRSGKDSFDSICMELQRSYDPITKLGACVQMFTGWYDSFAGPEILSIGNLLGYHSYEAIDFDRSDPDENRHYLVIQNSYGRKIGDGGFQKMYRPVVNQLLSQWGTSDKIPVALTPAEIVEARKETPLGAMWRTVIQMWYDISLLLVAKFGS